MNKINAAITAVHGEVPEKVLSNFDLEKMVDTNDEWIISRTGIKERRICLLYTSPSPRDGLLSRMPSSA